MQSVENNHKENLQGSDFMSTFALANVKPCIPRGVAQPGSAPGLGHFSHPIDLGLLTFKGMESFFYPPYPHVLFAKPTHFITYILASKKNDVYLHIVSFVG